MVLKRMEYSSVDDRAKSPEDAAEAVLQAGQPQQASSLFLDSLGPTPWDPSASPLNETEIACEFQRIYHVASSR